MTYVKINSTLYPAIINGSMRDSKWDDRSSKSITLTMSYADAIALFVDDITWSIVMDVETEDGTTTQEEYDNSEYCLAGSVTDHRDGTVTVKMGKLTQTEILEKQLEEAGGTEEYEAAYVEGVNSI